MKRFFAGNITTIILLLIIFCLVIFGGRYVISKQGDVEKPTSTPTPLGTAQPVSSPSVTPDSAVSPSPVSAASCASDLQAEVAKNKESYVKGQILVTFSPDLVYQKAKDVLATYGLVVQNENDSQQSFASRHLITAGVPSGAEISKVCTLRNDPSVKYAGLDLYFGLHE